MANNITMEPCERLKNLKSTGMTTQPNSHTLRNYRACSGLSALDLKTNEPQKLHILIMANCQRDISQAEALTVRFSNHHKIETRVVCDHVTTKLSRITIAYENKSLEAADYHSIAERDELELYAKIAYQLSEWADLLVLAPIDANTFAKMFYGMSGNLMLEILRGWDVSKRIILVPGMTAPMWENPMTRKQLNKVRRKWSWIQVITPILWRYDDRVRSKCQVSWDGFSELVEVIKNQAELLRIGHDVDITTPRGDSGASLKTDAVLPPELWTHIFQHVGDWEVSMALGIYTNLPKPAEWMHQPCDGPQDEVENYMRELEWTILTKPVPRVIEKLSAAPGTLTYLSSPCVKLIIKFGLTDILTYLEIHLKDVFWASFGSKLLPTKASAVYGRTEILEWWRTSSSFLKKDYTVEAIDGACKSGFVHVLDWWRKSGLPLKYTEAALEQASSKGHLFVLEWWREASRHQGSYYIDSDNPTYGGPILRHRHQSPSASSSRQKSPDARYSQASSATEVETRPLHLKVGKSILAAAQHGQAATVVWWDMSGIPYLHSEAVAKIASTYGHVNVLDTWKELKGEKFPMSFDNQVLVGPTKNGFVRVLEWWKEQTLLEGAGGGRQRVEYRTCDIEEALEDSVGSQGGEGEAEVRKWWARNGLNLGVDTSEWMKVKRL